jgi:hypothetical protein
MIDIKDIEKQARAELNKELSEKAKDKLKTKLRQIAQAERILQNHRDEYAALLLEVGADVG